MLFGLFVSCSPKIATKVYKDYGAAHYQQEIVVLGLDDQVPAETEILGELKIGDSGFTTQCTYEDVLEQAKMEARKIGGNAIHITEHKLPTTMGSTCHRIRAEILKVEHLDEIILNEDEEIIPDVDYAMLHVFRYSGAGSVVGYDLYLGDTVVCRVQNSFKQSIKINQMGLNTLWAKTESKVEVPIRIEPGHHYYLRCGIAMGLLVGRPTLGLVSSKIGKMEYESFEAKHQ